MAVTLQFLRVFYSKKKLMKKTIIYTLALVILITSCTYDDDNYAPQNGTDFSEDISDKTNFYLSTPIELKVLNNEFNNNTLHYNVGDTLKLELNLNSIFQETETDFYDLHNSTGAEEFVYDFYIYHHNIQKIVDLNLLETYPEISDMTETEIRTHPIFKYFFIDNKEIITPYNLEKKQYSSKIGIVLTENGIIYNSDINISSHITNKTNTKGINISIPIISVLDDLSKKIQITENIN